MSSRTRKFIGGLAMIAFVIVYALAAMALFQARPLQEAGLFVKTILYALIGLGWILPLMPLIRWMEGPRDQIQTGEAFPFRSTRRARRGDS